MAFGGFFDNTSEGVTYLPIIKYDAKSGRISRRDRDNGTSVDVDITKTFKAIIDLENVEVGWSDFTNGPPDFRLSRYADGIRIPKPSEGNFKRAVRFILKLSKECGGDIREFAANAYATLEGINALQDAYDAGVKENPGKLPIVVFVDSHAKTSSGGALKVTNYVPEFKIDGWVKRPDDLVYKARSSSTSSTITSPPSTGSTKVSAPGGADDFG